MTFAGIGRFSETFVSRTYHSKIKRYLEFGKEVFTWDLEATDFERNSDCGLTLKSIKICDSEIRCPPPGNWCYDPLKYGICNEHPRISWGENENKQNCTLGSSTQIQAPCLSLYYRP
jgi:hypothetical protein